MKEAGIPLMLRTLSRDERKSILHTHKAESQVLLERVGLCPLDGEVCQGDIGKDGQAGNCLEWPWNFIVSCQKGKTVERSGTLEGLTRKFPGSHLHGVLSNTLQAKWGASRTHQKVICFTDGGSMGAHVLEKQEGRKAWVTYKRSCFLLQRTSSALYWQSIASCQLAKEKSLQDEVPVLQEG